MASNHSDFSRGSVKKNILRLAVPLTIAQLIHLLYNIIDRMFIGHLAEHSTQALSGMGLTFPITMIIAAFTNLFSTGGAPLFSMARGEGDNKKASEIMGTCFTLMVATAAVLMVLCYVFKKPVLYLFGASDAIFPYADSYLSIYLIGTPMVMISLGMNTFINAQGFGRLGMMTVAIGCVLNIALDPLFIFVLDMGVAGAAWATVISQTVSALWVLYTILSPRMVLPLRREFLGVRTVHLKRMIPLGLSGFVMQITNSLVSIMCNSTLQQYGGDLYVGVMTVINSVREVLSMPVSGVTSASQPVISFNYGAGQYSRVKEGIRFMSMIGIIYTTVMWVVVLLWPQIFIRIFNNDPQMLEAASHAMFLYFFGFCFMSLQSVGQSAHTALGKAKTAIFFSIFRKVIIVVPLTLWLPTMWGLGVDGVFIAEPVSNLIGGLACFITMYLTVWRTLPKEDKPLRQEDPYEVS